MTDNSEDYIRLAGSYSDLESRVDDVVELLCAVRRKGKQQSFMRESSTLPVVMLASPVCP